MRSERVEYLTSPRVLTIPKRLFMTHKPCYQATEPAKPAATHGHVGTRNTYTWKLVGHFSNTILLSNLFDVPSWRASSFIEGFFPTL